eukprot:7907-Amphidinium_carterae.1
MQWVERCSKSDICEVLTLDGLVKSGKTCMLTQVLPQVVKRQMPDALICHLDFEFLDKTWDPQEMRRALNTKIYLWAQQVGIPLRHDLTKDLLSLMEALRESGYTIIFAIDEVQRYFQCHTPEYETFKGFLQVITKQWSCAKSSCALS